MRVDRAWVVAASFVTACWVAVTVAAWDLPFDTTGRGTSAAAAAAALTAAAWRPRTARAAALTAGGLVLLPLGLAVAAGGSAALLAATLVAAAAAETITALGQPGPSGRKSFVPALGLATAAACLIAGMAVDGGAGVSSRLPSGELGAALLGVAAGALLVLVASSGQPRARPLGVAGVLIGLVAIAELSPSGVAGTATLAAVLWSFRAPHRPSPALAALALAAAVLPVGGHASGLLAGAAALGVAFPHPVAALLGLPGASALASSFVATTADRWLVVVVLGTAATAVALARRRPAATASVTLTVPVHLLPVCGLAGWLLLSPGSWGWTGALNLGTYDHGAAVALAAALLAVLGTHIRARLPRPTS